MLRLSWLISIGLSLLGVMIIEHFFSLSPEGVAKAGNLGAVGIALVIPFILLSLVTTFRYFTEASRKLKDPILRVILIIAGIGLVVATAYYANEYKNDVYASLGGTMKDVNSIIYGYPMLNEYTNHIFINFYTFAFVHSICAVAGGVFGMIKPKKEMEQQENYHL